MNWQRVGKKIETLRDMRGFTQKYMGEMLGIKQNSYSVLESGKGLNEDRVEEIAKILSVPSSELLSPDPIVLTMHNNHGNNGNVNIENQQQHTMPQELLERLLKKNEER